jgi:hypothetical protein
MPITLINVFKVSAIIMIVLAKKLLSDKEIYNFQRSEDNSQGVEINDMQTIAHSAAQTSASLLLNIINNRKINHQGNTILGNKLKKSVCNLV